MVSSGVTCLLVFSFSVTATIALKSWIPRTNLNDKTNWNILDLPKNCDDISFAVTTGITLFWSFRDLIITGLKLPSTGSLSLDNEMTIYFKDRKLCSGARELVYKRNEWKEWLDPSNWKSDSSEMWKPHAERIPCSGENVKFPSGNNFAVQLPGIMVPVGRIYLEDEEYDGEDWGDYLNTESGKSEFRSENDVQVAWMQDFGCARRNCTCVQNTYYFKASEYKTVPATSIHQAVCQNAKKSCGIVRCYTPITVEGHCCGVCGGVLKIKDTSEDDALLIRIRDEVKKNMAESGGNVDYYVGRTTDGNIQVAIVSENGDQADDALALVGLVKDALVGENLIPIVSAELSGISYSGNFLTGTTGIFFGTLFAVLAFFGAIYFIYVVQPERNAITGEHGFHFARFKNCPNDDGSEEKLEIGREEISPAEQSEGFQNPTYSSRNEYIADMGLSSKMFRSFRSVRKLLFRAGYSKMAVVLSPRESGEYIAKNAKHITIHNEGINNLSQEIVENLKKGTLHMSGFSQCEVHPSKADESAVNWIFLVDSLNYCFWSANQDKWSVTWNGKSYTGYFALCAAINRAIDEGYPITDASYCTKVSIDELKKIFRGDNQSVGIPLLTERKKCLHEIGTVLLEKFDGSFVNCIKCCNGSAEKLLKLITDYFPCYKDEAVYNNVNVSFYKRAQILIGDIWVCFRGKDLGHFEDIGKLTMFADYRVPQVLLHFKAMKYDDYLMELLKKDEILENGSVEEMEIRGCSIHVVELINQRIKSILPGAVDNPVEANETGSIVCNSILIDHFLWDYRRQHAEQLEKIPFHKTLSIFY